MSGTPKRTLIPSSSKTDFQYKLASSSKRALNSITTVTCLPFLTAFNKALITLDCLANRYAVILILCTEGSMAASLNKSIIESKEW